MRDPTRAGLWGSAAAAGFLLLLVVTRLGLPMRLDERLTDIVQSRPSHLLDRGASVDTVIGDPIVTLVAALAIAGWLWGRGSPAFLAPLLIVVVSAVELVCKMSLIHAPPPSTYARAVEHLLTTGADAHLVSSYPSGHVGRVTFLAVLAAGVVPSAAVRIGGIALVAFTMLSRIYLGAHWPSDTVGGLLLGLAIAAPAVLWVGIRRLRPA